MNDDDRAVNSLPWVKSSFCESGTCAEVRPAGDGVEMRNSTDPGKVLQLSREQWEAFRAGVADGTVAP